MSELKTDEEKAEELKAWWRENGNSVIAGVALAIAALFGWEYWKNHQVETAEAAATLYSESQDATDPTQAAELLKRLQSDYSSTPYATMAALHTAKNHAEAGEYQQAVDNLQWVLDNSPEAEYQDVANLRLARVLIAMGQPDKALAVTEKSFAEAYEPLIEELRGDIYAAQNKTDDARKAYERAILTNQGGSTEFIQMKLDNLAKGA